MLDLRYKTVQRAQTARAHEEEDMLRQARMNLLLMELIQYIYIST